MAIRSSKTYLVWILVRKAFLKTSFIKIVDENAIIEEVTSLEVTASYKNGSKSLEEIKLLMDLKENTVSEFPIINNQSKPKFKLY